MKKLILFILLTVTFASVKGQVYQNYPQYGGKWKRITTLFNLGIPNDTFAVPTSEQSSPHIAAKGTDLYLWDTTAKVWGIYSSGGSSYSFTTPLIESGGTVSINGLSGYGSNGQLIRTTGSALQYFTPTYILPGDTAAMLANYRHWLAGYVMSNIYTADGSISGNRTVSLGGNKLTFDGQGYGTAGDTVSIKNNWLLLDSGWFRQRTLNAGGLSNNYGHYQIDHVFSGIQFRHFGPYKSGCTTCGANSMEFRWYQNSDYPTGGTDTLLNAMGAHNGPGDHHFYLADLTNTYSNANRYVTIEQNGSPFVGFYNNPVGNFAQSLFADPVAYSAVPNWENWHVIVGGKLAVTDTALFSGQMKYTFGSPAVNKVITSDANGNASWSTLAGIGGVTGSGTTNKGVKWTSTSVIGNSRFYDDGTFAGVDDILNSTTHTLPYNFISRNNYAGDLTSNIEPQTLIASQSSSISQLNMLWLKAPNMPVGSQVALTIGKNQNSKNTALWQFKYQGNGNDTNRMEFQFTGIPNVMSIYPTRHVTIGNISYDNGYHLEVNGKTRINDSLWVQGGARFSGLGSTAQAKVMMLDANGVAHAVDTTGLFGSGGSGITSINSQTGSSQTLATGTSGTDFAISSSGDTHTFNLPTASASNRGALSSTDWSTFNNKVPTTTTISTGYGLSGGGDLSTNRTHIVDSATLAVTFLRRKDSLTGTNPVGYVTNTVLKDSLDALGSLLIESDLGVPGASVRGSDVLIKAVRGNSPVTAVAQGDSLIDFSCPTCVTSAASLTNNALMIGQGSQGSATTTTGTGVITALGVNTGSSGAFVVNGGALGTPSSGTGTNLTGIPVTTGLTAGNWKVFYSNGSGALTELALGASGTVLTSNGASSAPSFTSATTYTASNGLTMSSNNVKLGGVLGENTTIGLDGFTIGIPDLQNFADTTNWKPMVTNTTGTGGSVGEIRKATYWPTGSGGGGGSPAGNYGNVQLNRNGAFDTPGSDSLDYENSTGLTVKNNIIVSGTGKYFQGRYRERVDSTTSSATPTINTDNVDFYKITAQAADITSFTTNLSGTPNEGDFLQIQITGTAARNITWGSSFVSSSVTMPTATSGTTSLVVVFKYFKSSSYGNNKWVCVNYY